MKIKIFFFLANFIAIPSVLYFIYIMLSEVDSEIGALVPYFFIVYIVPFVIVWSFFNSALSRVYKLPNKRKFYVLSAIMIAIQAGGLYFFVYTRYIQ